jgi:hypothetical protein
VDGHGLGPAAGGAFSPGFAARQKAAHLLEGRRGEAPAQGQHDLARAFPRRLMGGVDADTVDGVVMGVARRAPVPALVPVAPLLLAPRALLVGDEYAHEVRAVGGEDPEGVEQPLALPDDVVGDDVEAEREELRDGLHPPPTSRDREPGLRKHRVLKDSAETGLPGARAPVEDDQTSPVHSAPWPSGRRRPRGERRRGRQAERRIALRGDRPHRGSGIQLPWKPNGTRWGSAMVATGFPVKSEASRITRSLPSRAAS